MTENPAVVICATTGIAAVNLGDAVTLHATLKYFNTESLQENWLSGRLQSRMRKLRASGLTHYCIDECSMLPAEQLTCLVDAVDELNSEGAVAMGDEPEVGLTLIGDFLQLPPIKASYAFQSPRWESHFDGPGITRLDRIWRQDDPTFIQGLRAVRVGNAAAALEVFADRFLPTLDPYFTGTTIVARNDAVDRFNRMRHESLKGELFRFPAQITGTPLPEWEKDIPPAVGLKRGAFVVLLANKYDGHDYGWQELRYANGDQGILVDADPGRKVAYVELVRNRQVVTVEYNVRQNLEPTGKRSGPKENRFKILGEICYLPARLAWASTVHKCVAPDTRIPVLGSGYIPIEIVEVGDMTPYGRVKCLSETQQPSWRVTTARGYTVVCSADHRWMTADGLKPTDNLRPGIDRIALHAGIPFPGSDRLSVDEAWVLGAVVGDGCYTDRDDGTVEFSATHQAFGEQFRQTLLSAYAVEATWRKDRRGMGWTKKALRLQWVEDGLDYVKGPEKRIPLAVWYQGPAARGAFLSGLFDTDGHISGHRIVLTTASAPLAEGVQEMLLTLGIVSKRTQYPGVKGSKYWQIYVAAEDRDQFLHWVGFRHPDKREKGRLHRPNRVLNAAHGYDTIRTVEPLGQIIPMIDIEIEAPHLLPFGPFIGHNSQGLTLPAVQVDLNDPMFRKPAMTYVALSRAQTLSGLRLIGNPRLFEARCSVDSRVQQWA